ncbi:MAG: S-adenosylmethionine-diacylglycerol 3-amino-3-carboxypropyl transferase [Bacteroidetes bacterium]|nr:MAG: S-adenosylmethionine-diacylglycerol 3-amino-3-carboxypropyl transferase [Bacteroidota bacterium]
MSESLTHRVDFGFIRYANCWEDADILLQALDIKPGDRVLSVASAGDNSFSLLSCNPELVVAVDVNRIQLHLCELKKAAFLLPSHIEFMELLGFAPSDRRRQLFEKVSDGMSALAQAYWKINFEQIEAGIITQGKFEKYFGIFRKWILPCIHGRKKVEKLFAAKSAEEQEVFYRKTWNNWRWRLLFRIFFSKAVMGKYGRDPEFLKEVQLTVSRYIFLKAEKHLEKPAAQKNHFLYHIMLGHFRPQLPHYARPENFENIKTNLHKLQFREGYAQDVLNDISGINVMNLSNIFEYMNPEIFASTVHALVEKSGGHARFAYWNLMVPRRMSVINEKLVYLREVSENLSEADKGFFYNQFIVETKNG